jgi:hypothetical protein
MNVPIASAKTILIKFSGSLKSTFFFFADAGALITRVVVVSVCLVGLAVVTFACLDAVVFVCVDLAGVTFLVVFLFAMIPPYNN